jgi:hypothetical protein
MKASSVNEDDPTRWQFGPSLRNHIQRKSHDFGLGWLAVTGNIQGCHIGALIAVRKFQMKGEL